MIELTSISGRNFWLNSQMIYKIEEAPDTIITLSDGKIIRVVNSSDDIIDRIIEYKRKIFNELPEVSK